ncbi:MAG: hypothetical protein RR450_05780 [Oscillospiraceae bacterium]
MPTSNQRLKGANYPPQRRRIAVDLDEPTFHKLDKMFQYGERNRVMQHVILWLIEMYEEHGDNALLIFLRTNDYKKLLQLNLPEEPK